MAFPRGGQEKKCSSAVSSSHNHEKRILIDNDHDDTGTVTPKFLSPPSKRRCSQAEILGLEKAEAMIKKAQHIDIAFLVGATISMKICSVTFETFCAESSYQQLALIVHKVFELHNLESGEGYMFDLIQAKISTIATHISKLYPQSKIRVALVVHQDFEEEDDAYSKACDFTSSYDTPDSIFHQAISNIVSSLRNTMTQDVITGLETIVDLNWKAANRLLFHVTDAPCNEAIFYEVESCDDLIDQDNICEWWIDAHECGIAKILRKIQDDCRITRYFFAHMNPSTATLAEMLRRASGAESEFWLQDWTVDDKEFEFCKTVVAFSLMSISRALNEGGFQERMRQIARPKSKYRTEKIEKCIPAWSDVYYSHGIVSTHKGFHSIDALLGKLKKRETTEDDLESEAVVVQIAPHPFNAGASRWAYYAAVSCDGCFCRPFKSDHDLRIQVIAKRFKQPLGKPRHTRQAYMKEVEIMEIASYLSNEFTKRCNRIWQCFPFTTVGLTFSKVSLLSVESRLYLLQNPLKGVWIDDDKSVSIEDDFEAMKSADVLEAFSHFSYHISNGYFMITDMDGVNNLDVLISL